MEDLSFEYAFAYAATWRSRGLKKERVRGLAALGHARIRRVPGAETFLLARLRAVSEEAIVDVRTIDGEAYRTVCAPGSRVPCGVAEFVEAAAASPAWRDSPFLPVSPHDACERRAPFPPDAYDGGAWSDSTEANERMSVERTLGDYVAVDDVVYRRCVEPRLAPAVLSDEGGQRLACTWRWPDLSSHGPANAPVGHVTVLSADSLHLASMPGGFEAMSTFGIDREADAVAFCREQASARDIPFEESRPMVLYAGDESTRPDDVVGLVDVARFLTCGKEARKEWPRLVDLPSDILAKWASARDILRLPNDELDERAVRDAMDTLHEVATHPDAATMASALREVTSRWTNYESVRDLSRVAAFAHEGDVESLAFSFG